MSRKPTQQDLELAESAKKALADWEAQQKLAQRADAFPVFGLRPPTDDVRWCDCPMDDDTRRSVENWPLTLGVVGCATCSGRLK